MTLKRTVSDGRDTFRGIKLVSWREVALWDSGASIGSQKTRLQEAREALLHRMTTWLICDMMVSEWRRTAGIGKEVLVIG